MSARVAALPFPTPRIWVPPKLIEHGPLVVMANIAGGVIPAVAALLQIGGSCIINPPSCNGP
jgi:hypothetical protein